MERRRRRLMTKRHHALHATLEVKMITPINNDTQELVQASEIIPRYQLKLRGTNGEGIDVSLDLELIGDPHVLDKYQFMVGDHLGLVLRAID